MPAILSAFGISLLTSILYAWFHFTKSSFRVSVLFVNGISLVISAIYTYFAPNTTAVLLNTELLGHAFSIVFVIDLYAKTLYFTLAIVSFCVLVYSRDYLRHDQHINKYFSFLSLFIAAMIGLCFSNNILIFYGFWEIVGFCSYLLVGFWFDKEAAKFASTKAFLVNRVGDAFFMVGIIMYILHFDTFQFGGNGSTELWSGLFLFLGCLAKSAQFPLYVWLPNAMEGPTPVSALIHAATMVAAGVYLMIRMLPVFDPVVLGCITAIGLFTMLFGSVVAYFQTDIKKLYAFSTMSQLGFMIVAIGLKAGLASFFHLTTHAFFKAGLFLMAGLLIHQFHSQNIKDLKAGKNFLFYIHLIFHLSLIGFPFFSGFLSKEAILGSALQQPMVFCFLLLNTVFTTAYSFKLLFNIYFTDPNAEDLHANKWMLTPLFCLAVLSLGLIFSPSMLHLSHAFWGFNFTDHGSLIYYSLLSILIGSWVGYATRFVDVANFTMIKEQFYFDAAFVRFSRHVKNRGTLFFGFIEQMIETIILSISTVHTALSRFVSYFDKSIVDGLVVGFASVFKWLGGRLVNVQSGNLALRLSIILIFILLIIIAF